MRIAIRADASVSIGTGHVMRCLALAGALKRRGAQALFICREEQGNLCDLIEEQGFDVCRLPPSEAGFRDDAEQTIEPLRRRPQADWLLVDHYGLDAQWEMLLRSAAGRIMVIDDLADRPHACDLLLDQNYCKRMDERYRDLLPPACRLLLGPDYTLLRPEFSQLRARLRQRNGGLKRLLVFFGGSDPGNETGKALQGIRRLGHTDLLLDVVVGSSNPHREAIRALCAALPNAAYHCQVSNMAELMVNADLAIGAGGTTTWERCCLGLPALVSVLADNQAELTQAVSEYGACVNLGRSELLAAEDYCRAIANVTGGELAAMERRCITLVDGKGSERVADALLQ